MNQDLIMRCTLVLEVDSSDFDSDRILPRPRLGATYALHMKMSLAGTHAFSPHEVYVLVSNTW